MFTNLPFLYSCNDLDTRCSVPECESNSTDFNTPWLKKAIPHNDINVIRNQCERYKFIGNLLDIHENCTEEDLFSTTEVETCDNFIFETTEVTMTREVRTGCVLS